MQTLKSLIKNELSKCKERIRYYYWKLMYFYKTKVNSKVQVNTKIIPNSKNIYWIDPSKLIYSWEDDNKIRLFKESIIYKAIKDRLKKRNNLPDSRLYASLIRHYKSNNAVINYNEKKQLERKFRMIDDTINKLSNNKRNLIINDLNKISLNLQNQELCIDIGKNGESVVHTRKIILAIVILLKIKQIPVKIMSRNNKWIKFRKYLLLQAKYFGGKLYQPALHFDLEDIPSYHECEDRFNAIKDNINYPNSRVLDIGANLGYFCHKFEDIGYNCIAVENDPILYETLSKLKIMSSKKFTILKEDILESSLISKERFDIILALNIFHHFIKRKDTFEKFKAFLNRLKTKTIIFEPHKQNESQMKNSYIDFSEQQFIEFIMKHTNLKRYKLIYTAKDGRKIYKIYN